MVIEKEVATTALEHFQCGGVGAGAVLLYGQLRVVEHFVDRLPVGVTTDHDHAATLEVVRQARHQSVPAEIQVEHDLPQKGLGFQGVLAQFQFARCTRPDLYAAILNSVVQPCAGVGAQCGAIARMFQQAFAQLQYGAFGAPLAVRVGIRWKLVIPHVHQWSRIIGGRSGEAGAAVQGYSQREAEKSWHQMGTYCGYLPSFRYKNVTQPEHG